MSFYANPKTGMSFFAHPLRNWPRLTIKRYLRRGEPGLSKDSWYNPVSSTQILTYEFFMTTQESIKQLLDIIYY
jgi:hypothetical protein